MYRDKYNNNMNSDMAIYPKYNKWGKEEYREVHPVPGRLYRNSGRTPTEFFIKLPIALTRTQTHVDFPVDNTQITLEDLRSGHEHCMVTGIVFRVQSTRRGATGILDFFQQP